MGETSEAIRARVQAARDIQRMRFANLIRNIQSFVIPICVSERSGSFASYRTKVRV
jgi:predicted ATPase with chaperone activity